MLSPSSRPYIDASVPVLREHGLAITRHFYDSMFAAHPELKNIFNLGNQANGMQQTALAAAVLAYAANIDQPNALAPVVDRIAHKHASVGIKSAHYPIVGRHLLGAIKHVLGDAATAPLLAAWDEAYWLLAGELIAAEARLYDRANTTPGALRELEVSEVKRESEDVISLRLTDGGASPGSFLPGQYLSVAIDLPDGLRQLRQYSLCDAPDRPSWRIAVKREAGDGAPEGLVSNYLHANVRAGDRLRVTAPFGNFTPGLAGEAPIALLSAGVGITPLFGVLAALARVNPTRPVLFAHAARSPNHHPFREDLAALAKQLPNLRTALFYEHGDPPEGAESGRMALSSERIAPYAAGEFYLCGPLAFMREQWASLIELGVSPTRLHREVFGPELLDHLL